MASFYVPKSRPDIVQPIDLFLHRGIGHVEKIVAGKVTIPVTAGLAYQGYDLVLGGVLAQCAENVAHFLAWNG